MEKAGGAARGDDALRSTPLTQALRAAVLRTPLRTTLGGVFCVLGLELKGARLGGVEEGHWREPTPARTLQPMALSSLIATGLAYGEDLERIVKGVGRDQLHAVKPALFIVPGLDSAIWRRGRLLDVQHFTTEGTQHI